MTKYDIVVIGGGPAGITLAKRLGKKQKMLLVRPEDFSMIYCAMPYVIENLIEKEKCLKHDNLVHDSGAELHRDIVLSVDFDSKQLNFKESEPVQYDKLVIATGATPIIPDIEGSDLPGVMGFKTQKDLEKIISFVDSGLQKAVIVGAGAIGIELAQALSHRSIDVTLIDMAKQVLPNLVGKEFAQKVSEKLIKNDITLKLDSKISKLVGKECIKEVHLESGEIIYFDSFNPCIGNDNEKVKGVVVFAAGVKPELSFINDDRLEIGKQGIKVTGKMETNIPDVYAVGDCVQYHSFITKEVVGGKLATNAVPMAVVLADVLSGKENSYPGFVNGAATKIYDSYVGGTGLNLKAAQNAGFDVVTGYSYLTTQFPIMPDKKDLFVKVIADRKTKKILGGQVYSGEPVTHVVDLISFAIQKESTIDDLLAFSYSSQPYQSFYPASNPIVKAAESIQIKLQSE